MSRPVLTREQLRELTSTMETSEQVQARRDRLARVLPIGTSLRAALDGAAVVRREAFIKGRWVDVTQLPAQAPASNRREAYASLAPNHPSFRWQVNGTLVAHRRASEGVTACDRRGDLTVVVDDGIPPCPKCFPAS